MSRQYFLQTDRIGFSKWTDSDIKLAHLLWGDRAVTKYISAKGGFTDSEIQDRLQLEIHNQKKFDVQYWPVFNLQTEDFMGCCGLRPKEPQNCIYEIGVHLRPQYWGKGFAGEAVKAVIDYAFETLSANNIFAGHNPNNAGSKKLLEKLGFHYIGDRFYEPTRLYHPSYRYR